MSDTLTVNNRVSADGRTYRQARTVTADGKVTKSPTLAAAKTGTLTTRTDDNTGVVTGLTGHGVATSDLVDVYWTGGCRYGMAATVSGNAITLDGGAGDNLPVVNTAVTFMEPQLETFIAAAADVQAIVVGCVAQAVAVFRSDAPATVLAAVVTADSDYVWDGTTSTPLGDDLVEVYLSHGDSTGAREVSAVCLVN